jgi:outer membrane protein
MLQILVLFLALPAYAATLPESFQAALKRSESLTSQEKLALIADERHSQARGAILPNLSANGSYTIQDRPADPLAEAFFPRTQPEAKLTLRQPLFRGLREFAALRQFRSLGQAERHAHERARWLLYQDVSRSYHAVLAAEENLRNTEAQLKLYDERIGDLNGRVRQGTSGQTDLLSLQASRAGVQSQLLAARASRVAEREGFAFLTGLDPDTALAPIEPEPRKPEPLAAYLQGVEGRPDLLERAERVKAADAQVSIAQGAHAPSVDLLANYYFVRQSDVYRGIDWDVMASVSLPLFSGGAIAAQAREARLERERADLELVRARRQAQQEVRALHAEYLAGTEAIAALHDGLRTAERNYQLLRRDFSRGLTRNLDVLQALITAHEVRRELLRTRYAAEDRWVQLNLAAGRRPQP